jgi:hypothetical protein
MNRFEETTLFIEDVDRTNVWWWDLIENIGPKFYAYYQSIDTPLVDEREPMHFIIEQSL